MCLSFSQKARVLARVRIDFYSVPDRKIYTQLSSLFYTGVEFTKKRKNISCPLIVQFGLIADLQKYSAFVLVKFLLVSLRCKSDSFIVISYGSNIVDPRILGFLTGWVRPGRGREPRWTRTTASASRAHSSKKNKSTN